MRSEQQPPQITSEPLRFRSRTPWDRDVLYVHFQSLGVAPAIVAFVLILTCTAVSVVALMTMDVIATVFALLPVVLGLFSLVALLAVKARAGRRRRAWQRVSRLSAGSSRVILRQAVEALVNLGCFERGIRISSTRRWRYRRIREQMEQRSLPVPSCIVEAGVRLHLRQIPRTEELLETDLVGRSVHRGDWTALLVLIAITLVLWAAAAVSQQVWVGKIALVAVALTLLYLFNLLFVVVSSSANRARALIIGPGAIAAPGRLFCRNHACTIAYLDGMHIRVDVLAEAGRLTFRFMPQSEAFADFWRRWMHPRPQPEMVKELMEPSRP